ncbi:hypothetical protein CF319_g3851 [Tilletia indica]|nr:hypothetical protein CF319_g3851 [Tilletia indica]
MATATPTQMEAATSNDDAPPEILGAISADDVPAYLQAFELERHLREIVLSVASILQLRRQLYAGQGEQAASLIPTPLSGLQLHPAGASRPHHHHHHPGHPQAGGPGSGVGLAKEGVNLVMAARVQKLAAHCNVYTGNTNHLRDWLVRAITVVDAELDKQLKLMPAPPPPPPAHSVLTVESSQATGASIPASSPAMAVPFAAVDSGGVITSTTTPSATMIPATPELINLAGDDDDDELPLGQLRDRTKASPSKPAASASAGSSQPRAAGTGTATTSRKRKRTTSSATTGNHAVVDLTGDSPSPPSAAARPISSKSSKTAQAAGTGAAESEKNVGRPSSSAGIAVSTSPASSNVPAMSESAASAHTAAVAGDVSAAAKTSTMTIAGPPEGDLFSMTQPGLDLSALHYDYSSFGAGGGAGSGHKGSKGQSNATTSSSNATAASTTAAADSTAAAASSSSGAPPATGPAPVVTATSMTAAPVDPLAGFGGMGSLDASNLGLDSEAMAVLSSMDFSTIDFSSLGGGGGSAGGGFDGLDGNGGGMSGVDFSGLFSYDTSSGSGFGMANGTNFGTGQGQ